MELAGASQATSAPKTEGPQSRTDLNMIQADDGTLNHSRQSVMATEAAVATPAEPQPLYSIFTLRRKQTMVMMISFVAIISPLSGNIYYPAIPALSKEFHVSTTLIQLTITAYQASQYHLSFVANVKALPTNNARISDLPRLRADSYRKFLGQPRTTTCICLLRGYLPRCQHRVGSADQLSSTGCTPMSAIDWVRFYSRTCIWSRG